MLKRLIERLRQTLRNWLLGPVIDLDSMTETLSSLSEYTIQEIDLLKQRLDVLEGGYVPISRTRVAALRAEPLKPLKAIQAKQ